jgi:hypothetical protein
MDLNFQQKSLNSGILRTLFLKVKYDKTLAPFLVKRQKYMNGVFLQQDFKYRKHCLIDSIFWSTFTLKLLILVSK